MDLDPIVPQPGNDRDPAHFVSRVETTTRTRERLRVGANLLLTDPKEFLTKPAETLTQDKGLPARVRALLSKIFNHVESFGVSGALTITIDHPPVSPHLRRNQCQNRSFSHDGRGPHGY